MSYKLFISAGHSATVGIGRDNGAASKFGIEGVEADKFRDLVVKELEALHVPVITDGDDTILADTIREFKKTANEHSILVEFHFNAATPKATGTEVLVPNNPTILERQIAEAIAKAISETLEIPMRGAKGVKTEKESARGSLGFMRVAGENILPEICFISNETDMKKFQANKSTLAKKVAKILHDFAKIGDSPKECFYTVQANDTLSKIAAAEKTTVHKLKQDNGLTNDTILVGQKLKL